MIALARKNKIPVVHVAHHNPGAGAFDPNCMFNNDLNEEHEANINVVGDGAKIISKVAPVDGEEVVIKALPNSFIGTNLKEVLDKLKVKHLIVIGFMIRIYLTID